MEKKSLSLLLLPPPPSILSSTNTKDAYGPTIDATVSQLKHERADEIQLDIAVLVPSSWIEHQGLSRTMVFKSAQKTLSQIYSLLCSTAANKQVELDCLGGINARAFFILPFRKRGGGSEEQAEQKDRGEQEENEENLVKQYSGPFIELTTFIASHNAYETLFEVEGEEGESLLTPFIDLYESKHRHIPTCQIVPGGSSFAKDSAVSSKRFMPQKSHTSVAVGGTFDHLHIGHKLLLTATALLAEPKGSQNNPSQTVILTIGISGDDLLTKKKFAEEIESWDERQQKVADFLESIVVFSTLGDSSREVARLSATETNGKCVRVTFGSNIRINYVEIIDPFGPTITDQNISALVLSQETRSGGQAINEKRRQKGWMPLEIFEIDVLEVDPTDEEEDQAESTPARTAFESKISSTDIRRRIHEKVNAGR